MVALPMTAGKMRVLYEALLGATPEGTKLSDTLK